MRKPYFLGCVLLVWIFLLAACSSAPVLRYINISPASATITAGTTQSYTATGYYSNGSVVPNFNVTWTSSNTSIATIDPASGIATGVAAGTSSVTASALGLTSPTATLNVQQLVSVGITPTNSSVPLGTTQQLMATAIYKNPDGSTAMGTAGAITSQVEWTSGSTSVATFNATTPGLATGLSEGTTLVKASFDGVTGTTNLTVGPPVPQAILISAVTSSIAVGNSLAVTAEEAWTDGSKHVPSGSVVWTSDTPTVANIIANSTPTALAAGFAPGSAHITATEGSLTPATTALAVVTGSTHFAYVSNYGDSTIGEYTVNASSAPYLTSAGTVSTPTLKPSQTVLNPNGKYLYLVATSSNTNVTVFNITSTGTLTSSGAAPVTAGPADTPYGVIDPYGRFLYVADYTANSIYGFQISQADGSLTPIAGSPFTVNVEGPICLLADHSGQFLYATNGLSNTISAYQISQTGGALAPLAAQPQIATGNAPGISSLDSTGAYLYVPNSVDGTVSSYSVAASGVLTNVGTTIVTGAQSILNVAVDPSDKYLYVLDAGILPASGMLYSFALSSGVPGTSPVGPVVSTGLSPEGIAIDPTGKLIAAENAGEGIVDSTISLFTVASGEGVLIPQASVSAGINPLFVTFYNAP